MLLRPDAAQLGGAYAQIRCDVILGNQLVQAGMFLLKNGIPVFGFQRGQLDFALLFVDEKSFCQYSG